MRMTSGNARLCVERVRAVSSVRRQRRLLEVIARNWHGGGPRHLVIVRWHCVERGKAAAVDPVADAVQAHRQEALRAADRGAAAVGAAVLALRPSQRRDAPVVVLMPVPSVVVGARRRQRAAVEACVHGGAPFAPLSVSNTELALAAIRLQTRLREG